MERILAKELKQLQKDYGDMLISNSEAQYELESLRKECNELRARLRPADDEIARLKDQFEAQLRDFTAQVKIFKKQNLELSGEIARLELSKARIEGECVELKRENAKMEEFWKKEKKIIVEKMKEDKERSEIRYNNLDNRYSAVLTAATDRYKMLSDRLTKLEKDVAILKQDAPVTDSLVDIYETTLKLDEISSSMPGSTCVKTQSEDSESDTRMPLVSETLASENISASAVPFVVDLGSSDDDDELSSAAAVKRKLPTTGTSDKREEDSGSFRKYMKYTRKSGVILQPCAQKVGVASDSKLCGVEAGNSNKEWDFAADMLDSLQQDIELCMKGVCALSRQRMLSLREEALVKFLTDGDAEGRLKKTLADLEAFNPKGADECKRIVVTYSKELYGIYKGGNDPFFARDTVFSQKAII